MSSDFPRTFVHTVAFPVYTAALGGNRSLALFDGGDLGLFDGLHSRFFSNNLSMSFKAGSRDFVMRSSASLWELMISLALSLVYCADWMARSPRDDERDAFLVVSSCSRKMRAAASSLCRFCLLA
eukprot:CAMPEP_0185577726 /NCGR_PEP_ID=MMETSP0434-20130131/10847_1 /TAXON_ID=626734 ORGANISM="Favella taraikaensis, Strain Fe Narragansett Bay" /NCGR_SAMPLE_ID=MMETSP0434 /ASSEMBLY_ACC=CAM_ASM_000379 /LENGTH=124 /DNA_ID=CAMNT_0028195367 /DNA_START=107 /DNA_END=479 /DNA_ORIENTATION=+